MDSIGNYKNRALATLKGNWDNAVIATLVYSLIAVAFGYGCMGIFSFTHANEALVPITSLLLLPMGWGFYILFLNFVRGKEIKIGDMFIGYNSQNFVRTLLTSLLAGIIIYIGLILVIIPGIILSLMYSQFYFIMKDDPEIKYMAALKKSAAMMDGHKMELFKLCLSFIGWGILCCLLPIGFLWLEPYCLTTFAHYYEDLKAEYEGAAVVEEAPAKEVNAEVVEEKPADTQEGYTKEY